MDNNTSKKQQQYARFNSKTSLGTDSNRKSSSEVQSNQAWPKNSRRRENPSTSRSELSHRNAKQQNGAKSRPYVDKRPRARGGGSGINSSNADSYYDGATCPTDDFAVTGTGLAQGVVGRSANNGAIARNAHNSNNNEQYEMNSVYMPGSKKINLNHLLNFHYTSPESDHNGGHNVFGRGSRNGGGSGGSVANARRHKYNKEQFLQANFQFIINSTGRRLVTSPDTLIDWQLIEQINIQTTEEPQCPICLYPPIAAKLTRCGHAYCWPCILHYLALSDKTWNKCPICYEAIHISDLKSTAIVQQKSFTVGEEVTFHLMRRKKGSMFIEKFTSNTSPCIEHLPHMSGNEEAKLFSKLLVANRTDILNIIEREQRELTTDEDPTCPEFMFIQQALDLLKERRQKLGNIQETLETISTPNEMAEMEMPNKISNDIIEETVAADQSLGEIAMGGDAIVTKYYYFYQFEDGQNVYLHPLNVKMLQAFYGSLERGPLIISARVMQKEHYSMDEDNRRKFTCLSHLPLTCQFTVAEVELRPPIVGEGILRLFKEDLLFRKKERQRREREERKRERHIDEINDRQMGKLIASTANLNLTSTHEFPTCGFEESLLAVDELDSIQNGLSTTPSSGHASYSSIAVTGSPQAKDLWPTLNRTPSHGKMNSSGPMQGTVTVWGRQVGSPQPQINARSSCRTISDRSTDPESVEDILGAPTTTNLGDVLVQAMSQNKQKSNNLATFSGGGTQTGGGSSNGGGKKQKRGKKMLPVFSTGMNFNGN